MRLSIWAVGLLAAALDERFVLAANPQAESFGPSKPHARRRGPDIFNAVNNAMRQWGSSLHHNGMSFFLATVPKGVLLHHGNSSPKSPEDPDWLAYEIEHAENFARGRRGPGGPPGRSPPGEKPGRGPGLQTVISSSGHGFEELEQEEVHGYLHTYETTRPLHFLYVDGMGGGKTSMGTLDSQDYLLRGQTPSNGTGNGPWLERLRDEEPGKNPRQGGPLGEQQRADELCELCRDWGLQGVIRMEAGFEIIKCDFSVGLDEVQALQRPDALENEPRGMGNLEYIRGLSERYQGIGSTRTIIDYSSMVSALFFPVNLTNPDPKRPDLPRLFSAEKTQLEQIKSYLGNVIEERRDQPVRIIDWQDVSDIIVGRYADRLKFMAEDIATIEIMAREVNFLLTMFIDYSGVEIGLDKAIDRCTNFYLRSVTPVTEADYLIKIGFAAVTHEICTTLFQVRSLIVVNPAPDRSSLAASVSALRSLMGYLNWTRFKRCPACAIDEVCLIPMWPIGTVEDYNTPRCTNGSDARDGESYWGNRPGRPPGGGGRPGERDGRGPMF